MNYNAHTPFSEQDYHLLKTHQSSGNKPYEIVTVEKNTVAQLQLVANVDNLNDIAVFLNVPALGSSAISTELVLQFTGDNELDKQVYQISCSKTARTSHMVTFKNTDGFYELSYSTPANGEIGLDQKSWTAKTWNAKYNTNIGSFTQIPVTKITLSVDNLADDENLPVGTQMGVLAR